MFEKLKPYDDLTSEQLQHLKTSMMPDAIGMGLRRTLELIWMSTPERSVKKVEQEFRTYSERILSEFREAAKREGRS